jgi:Flp pilus assembly pilin Flp
MRLPDTLLGLFVRCSVRIDTVIAGPARGQGLVEYALILALIAIIAIVALVFLGGKISTVLRTVGTSI